MKNFLRKIIPNNIFIKIQLFRYKKEFNNYKSIKLKKSFEDIYKNKKWLYKKSLSGKGSQGKYLNFSLKIINNFKKILKNKVVCDLGCGDFNFGKNIYRYFKKYIGVDIVKDIININKKKFISKKIEFICLNAVSGVPKAEIYIIRQVLQHLDNKNIFKLLKNIIKHKPKKVFVFEEVPNNNFFPNVDLPINGNITRVFLNSGVDLTEKPFSNLKQFRFIKLNKKVVDNFSRSKLVCYLGSSKL